MRLTAVCLAAACTGTPGETGAVEAFFISCMAAHGHEVWDVRVPAEIEDCCGFSAATDSSSFDEAVHQCEQQIYRRFGWNVPGRDRPRLSSVGG